MDVIHSGNNNGKISGPKIFSFKILPIYTVGAEKQRHYKSKNHTKTNSSHEWRPYPKHEGFKHVFAAQKRRTHVYRTERKDGGTLQCPNLKTRRVR